jgi:hypothetical protein
MLFKNSARTSKRTPHFTITKINWLMLFKEIITVYTENHTKTHQNNIQRYSLLNHLVHTVTIWLSCFEKYVEVVFKDVRILIANDTSISR